MLKIILSRKGFDETAGGKASPIYDDKFVSFPIPYEGTKMFYKDLYFDNNIRFIKVMKDLGINYFSEAHLDPDLRKSILNTREKCWLPMFGQDDSAQTILFNSNVGVGDVFLFFGWFKKVKYTNGRFKYVGNGPGVHAIYGYLEVGQVIDVNSGKIPTYAKYHSHVVTKNELKGNNTLYVAKESSSICSNKPGAAFFKFNRKLVLTKNNEKKSIWRLPLIFKNELQKFNGKMNVIEEDSSSVTVNSIGRTMQELYIGNNQEIIDWARSLIKNCEIYV